MNTFEIALRSKNLPKKLEDILPLRAMGNVYLSFCKAKLKELKKLQLNGKTDETKLKLLQKQQKETLRDGQDAGDMLLDWEAEIGRISETMSQSEVQKVPMDGGPYSRGSKKAKIIGLKNRQELSIAQTIKNHPKEVAEIKREARANNDIATKTAVINKIKMKRYQEMLKKPKKQELPDINSVVLSVFNKLNECYGKLNEVIKYKKHLSDFNREGLIEAIDRLNKIRSKLI